MFHKYSNLYDLIYDDKNTAEEAEYLDIVLRAHGLKNASLLEFGSGTGRHAAELTKFGHSVHGVEVSEDMVNKTISGKNLSFEVADVLDLNINRYFDCVISMFHVASYQITNKNIIKFFKSASRHLKPGGLFIFDFWYTPAVINLKPEVRIKKVESDNYRVWRIADPKIETSGNIVNVNYKFFVQDNNTGVIETFDEIHPMRHFGIPELELIADVADFKLIRATEFCTENAPSMNSWGVMCVFEKV